jgi:hypothetical protein
MRILGHWTLGLVFVVALSVSASADSTKKFVITDDCDPTDSTWMGGCFTVDGQVSLAEFRAALPGGHPSWRIEPPYVQDSSHRDIRVTNTGGRTHTFTEVTRFGNGYVAPLNSPGAPVATECVAATGGPSAAAVNTTLVPGQELVIEGLTPGTHNFECCIHPWMRAVVKVADKN